MSHNSVPTTPTSGRDFVKRMSFGKEPGSGGGGGGGGGGGDYGPPKRTGTIGGSVANMANSAIGGGVLAFPYSFHAGGLALGSFVSLLFFLMVRFSMHVIGKAQLRSGARTLQAIAGRVLGRRAERMMLGMQMLYITGSCVAYHSLVWDQLGPILRRQLGAEHPLCDRTVVVVATAALVVLPLCTIEDMERLAPVATTSMFAVFYMLFFVLGAGAAQLQEHGLPAYEDAASPANPIPQLAHLDGGIFRAIPIICFGFIAVPTYPMVLRELADPPAAQADRLPTAADALRPAARQAVLLARMDTVCTYAFATCLVVYCACGCVGCLYSASVGFSEDEGWTHANSATRPWRRQTPDDVLLTYPPEWASATVARCGIAISVLSSYVSIHYTIRTCFEDLCLSLTGAKLAGWRRRAQPALFVASTTLISLYAESISTVLGLNGAICGVTWIFYLPAALLRKETQHGKYRGFQALLVGGAGVVIQFICLGALFEWF